MLTCLALTGCGARSGFAGEPGAEGCIPGDAATWTIETVDTAAIDSFAVAEGPDGQIHVVYNVSLHPPIDNVPMEFEMRHAAYAGQVWTTEVIVPEASDLGEKSPVVAVGDDGGLHLAYVRPVRDETGTFSSSELHYAARGLDGRWSAAVVDQHAGNTTWTPAIALGPSGEVHILYSYFPDGDSGDGMRHATNATGSFVPTSIGGGTTLAGPGSLVVDAGGTAHAGYLLVSPGASGAAAQSAVEAGFGSWSVITIEQGVEQMSNLALDAEGTLHVALVAWPDEHHDEGELPFLRQGYLGDPSHWFLQTFVTGDDAPSGPWLAFGSDGEKGTLYADRSAIYRHEGMHERLRFIPATGSIETVDDGGDFDAVLLLVGSPPVAHAIYQRIEVGADPHAPRALRHAVRSVVGPDC